MKTKVFTLILVFLVAFLLFFSKRVEAPERIASPTLSTRDTVLFIELAVTEEERILGLGNREAIGDDKGMLFVFPKSDRHGIWMKGMLFPLDIIWLQASPIDANPKSRMPSNQDVELRVVDIKENVAPNTYPEVFLPKNNASYVLEMKSGGARKSGIDTGAVVIFKR